MTDKLVNDTEEEIVLEPGDTLILSGLEAEFNIEEESSRGMTQRNTIYRITGRKDDD